jgi:hypothetical protein
MHDRVNDSSADTKRPATETMANIALVLNVSAIVALAICVGGAFSGGIAAAVGMVAAFCFVASLACFAADNASTPVALEKAA